MFKLMKSIEKQIINRSLRTAVHDRFKKEDLTNKVQETNQSAITSGNSNNAELIEFMSSLK